MSKMDRLYGVTMPEKGISQLVAVDLQKAKVWSHDMSDDPFKTRLKIAKDKAKNKYSIRKREPNSNIGQALN